MSTAPHDKVYTRLGISKIHGIGVFAILDIPKDELLFFGDKSSVLFFKEEELELNKLPDSIQKLYNDFCIIKKRNKYKTFGCPVSFNNMTISWYLNHSDNPNVFSDNDFNFYSIRDIKIGEELTIDYTSYSSE